jgi:hypothetical protein
LKKLIFALMACAVLVGCSDKGKDFVGVWKSSGMMIQTITVEKASSGYRATAKLDKDTNGYMTVEAVLEPESDKLLVTSDKQKALELDSDGKLISYLRNGTTAFTRVK